MLNKFPSSQEFDDLLVLEKFPILLWVIFVLMDPELGIQSRSGFETVNSTSVLNKLATSQEVNDLLVLAEFPLLL
jgi:hypothetical protein